MRPRVDPAAALIFAADAATAVAAACNAAWLSLHRLRTADSQGRRAAAMTLVLLNAGIAVQAAFAQALYSAHRFALSTEPFFTTGPWLASRVVLLAGTLLLSVLILRSHER